jgi:hypothetical protein
VNCLKPNNGNIVIDSEEIKDVWKGYMKKLLNEENAWDGITDSDKTEGPSPNIMEAEVALAIKRIKRDKAAGPTKVVVEMFKDGGDPGIQYNG